MAYFWFKIEQSICCPYLLRPTPLELFLLFTWWKMTPFHMKVLIISVNKTTYLPFMIWLLQLLHVTTIPLNDCITTLLTCKYYVLCCVVLSILVESALKKNLPHTFTQNCRPTLYLLVFPNADCWCIFVSEPKLEIFMLKS